MVKHSLKKLLSMFPWFFDKSVTSNFYKSQDVTNKRFQDLYQSYVDIYESFNLNKKCLIWKEQEHEFDYIIHFIANYPNLKSVKCYKNDELIYMESFNEWDEQDSFQYSYIFNHVSIPNYGLNVFKCTTCNEIYFSIDSPDTCENCNESSFEKLNIYHCESCNEIYFDNELENCLSCNAHDLQILYVYKCESCNEIYFSNEELTTCPYCGVLYNNISGIGNGEVNTNVPVIPTDSFRIKVETYDEYVFEKGFPENDVAVGDIYDHDESLDTMGALNNIPRKEYILVDESKYHKTEPPFNNRLSEDDYHYMNRILEYNLRLHDTPLPVLEIWKLYGLSAVMLNRERLLLKMFDETLHDFDYETDHVLDWNPEPWEHKDGFCECVEDFGKYFFVISSTNFPKKFKPVTFNFKLIDSLNRILDEHYTIDIYLNDESLELNVSEKSYTVNASQLEDTNVFRFIAKDNENNIIGDITLTIEVQGCKNADFYVNSNGNDDNPGTINEPFLTLNKALTNVTNTKNLIVIQGDIQLESTCIVNHDCTILGCENASINNETSNKFFKLNNNISLSIFDLGLNGKDSNTYIQASDFYNRNVNPLIIRLPGDDGIEEINSLHISDLNINEFITDIKMDNHSLVIVKSPLSDFNTISDLEEVIMDVEYDKGKLKITRFKSIETDENVLANDIINSTDSIRLYDAVNNIIYSNGVLIKEMGVIQ